MHDKVFITFCLKMVSHAGFEPANPSVKSRVPYPDLANGPIFEIHFLHELHSTIGCRKTFIFVYSLRFFMRQP